MQTSPFVTVRGSRLNAEGQHQLRREGRQDSEGLPGPSARVLEPGTSPRNEAPRPLVSQVPHGPAPGTQPLASSRLHCCLSSLTGRPVPRAFQAPVPARLHVLRPLNRNPPPVEGGWLALPLYVDCCSNLSSIFKIFIFILHKSES